MISYEIKCNYCNDFVTTSADEIKEHLNSCPELLKKKSLPPEALKDFHGRNSKERKH